MTGHEGQVTQIEKTIILLLRQTHYHKKSDQKVIFRFCLKSQKNRTKNFGCSINTINTKKHLKEKTNQFQPIVLNKKRFICALIKKSSSFKLIF